MNRLRMMDKIEPLAFVSQARLHETYRKDLKLWSRITKIETKLQAEVIVYSLDGHASGIKEKIQDGIAKNWK